MHIEWCSIRTGHRTLTVLSLFLNLASRRTRSRLLVGTGTIFKKIGLSRQQGTSQVTNSDEKNSSSVVHTFGGAAVGAGSLESRSGTKRFSGTSRDRFLRNRAHASRRLGFRGRNLLLGRTHGSPLNNSMLKVA